MHRDLSAHLHTDECNKLIMALFQCRAENPFGKFVGACNQADYSMTQCLKREMDSHRQRNLEKAHRRLTKKQKHTIYDEFDFDNL